MPCLVSKRAVDPRTGYPRVTVGHAKHALQHRVVWEEANGPIPDGMVVHHICENKACVNVEHMTLMTKAEHGSHHHPRQCEHGEEERRYFPSGQSHCRACKNERRRKGVVSHHA